MAKNMKGLLDRKENEQNENKRTINTGLPTDRFNGSAQVSDINELSNTKAATASGEEVPSAQAIVASKATAVKKKMAIKPSAEIDVEQGKQIGGVSLGETAMTMSAAGDVAIPTEFGSSIPRDQSRIPYTTGGQRGATRQAKKNSPDNFVLNNMACEQIVPIVEESKDLREAPDALAGYNGRKQFDTARGKKNAGIAPGSLLYERSADLIGHSAIVHTTGQVLDNIDQEFNGYPVATAPGALGEDETVMIEKGNFLLKGFSFDIIDGHIANPSFQVDQYKVPVSDRAAEYANMNWQVDSNITTKTMVKLQTELGRETTDKWSPLGYVIHDPYKFCQLFHDGEAATGALMGAAYKAASHSLAFMLNMCGKDGIKGREYIKAFLNNDRAQYAHSSDAEKGTLFNRKDYQKGSADAMIALFDSPNKYTTKADFFNQPRSWKMHLQKVDNYINALHCKKEFLGAYNQAMMFSTADGTYNPVLPIHYTDNVKLFVPYDPNVFLQGWSNPHVEHGVDNTIYPFWRETGIKSSCKYSYNDLRRITYEWAYSDPLVAGLMRWMLIHESKIVEVFSNRNDSGTYTTTHVSLPCHFGMGGLNLFSLFLCSAAADVLWMRNVIFRDYLFAGDQGVYIFDDLTSLSEANFVKSTQYGYKGYGSPLELGALSDCQKIRTAWPELIQMTSAFDTNLLNERKPAFILPFYFSEEQLPLSITTNDRGEEQPATILNDDGLDDLRGGCFSYPSIRQGLNHEYVDVIHSMDERTLRLCYDRMVTIPYKTDWTVETNSTSICEGRAAATDFHYTALRYDVVSDGRVIMTNIEDGELGLTEETLLATPRELGFLFPMPTMYGKTFVTSVNGSGVEQSVAVSRNSLCMGGAPMTLRCYYATGNFSDGSVINRTASLTQAYVSLFAHPSASTSNIGLRNIGVIPSLAACFNVANEDGQVVVSFDNEVSSLPCLYRIGEQGVEDSDIINRHTLTSWTRGLWSILQRIPMVINPFDSAYEDDDYDGSEFPGTAIQFSDPLEFAILFGLCGFLASDYHQDVMNRLDIKDELGMYYYEDEFIKASPLFRV